MRTLASPWRRPVLILVMLALVTASSPLPAMAADAPPSTTPAGTHVSPVPLSPPSVLSSAVAHAAETPALAAGVRAQTAPDTTGGSGMKGAKLAIVLALFGAGVGYALYSASHDRITSPGR